jgi:hypothetical protein
MAKDPAFLFYSGDFLVGTALFTEAETGQYIKLLCFMHQGGHISKEDMFNICPNISFKVLAKFKMDSNGLYYNERLDIEVEKRKNYSESRRSNRLKKKTSNTSETYVQSYVEHMENGNENRIGNINDQKGVQGETKPTLKVYQEWINHIEDGTDLYWPQLLRGKNLKLTPESLQDLSTRYIGLLSEYPKKQPPDQHAFRLAFLAYCVENKTTNNGNNNSRNNSKSEHTASGSFGSLQ